MNPGDDKTFRPSRREQRALWRTQAWSRLAMRWIGTVGVIYEAMVKHDPVTTLVFGALGTGLDVGSLTVALVKALRAESRAIEDAVRDGERSQDGRVG